ncbi:hypothetical protein BD779DRAFT_1532318 [Infundibulicybe gibba]|nr:hypothetical protein BD779DRAFT_1532318 [Infundibulicybe gibba]
MHQHASIDFFRALPHSPSVDVSQTVGNLTREDKQLTANVCYWLLTGSDTSGHTAAFSSSIGRRLKIAELDVWRNEVGITARGVCEIVVQPDMCNLYGTLHGGCSAYLIDSSCLPPLIAQSLIAGHELPGASQAMDIRWHHPGHAGMTLQITCTTIEVRGKATTLRAEIRDKKDGRILVSAVQARADQSPASPPMPVFRHDNPPKL